MRTHRPLPRGERTKRQAAGRPAARRDSAATYVLEDQVGFLLRRVNQRHTTIFAERMLEDLTPTQWAALAKLFERGPLSQNLLGRQTAMDAATIKGVVDRLAARGFTAGERDPEDARRRRIALTGEGRALVKRAAAVALVITEETLNPLNASERKVLMRLLDKIK